MNINRRILAIAGLILVLSLFMSPGPVVATPAETLSEQPHLTAAASAAARGRFQAPPNPDFGDAPDSSNNLGLNNTAYADTGTLGQFPTVWQGTPAGQPAGPAHFDASLVFLGDTVTFEARADSGADADGVNNILDGGTDNAGNDGGDDGWLNPTVPFPHCGRTTLVVRVSRAAAAANVGPMYLNVWFDGNRDGDWQDAINCPGVEVQPLAAEWIVRNFVVDATQIAAGGFQDISVNTFRIPNAAPDMSHWLRFTLSENQLPPVGGQLPDGRGPHPPNGHNYGETEDYLQQPPAGGQPGNLILNKSVDATTPVSPGDTVNYTIELEHVGGSAPASTEIKDMLPAGLAFLGPFNIQTQGPGAVPQMARFKKGTVGWRGMIAPDSKLTISFPVRVLPCAGANPVTINNVATATQTDNSTIQATAAFNVDCASGLLLSNVQATAGFMEDGNLAQTASLIPGQTIPLRLEVTNNNNTEAVIGLRVNLPEAVVVDPSDPSGDYLTINLGPGETKPIDRLLRLTEDVEDGTELNISLTYCLLAGEEYFDQCGSAGRLSTPARPEQDLPPLKLIVYRRDLGDAPDSSNHPAAAMAAYPGVPANFPTVRDTATGTPPGPAHIAPKPFHLGRRVSLEVEADIGPDQDPPHNIRPAANIPNLDRADDGIRPQLLNFSHCQPGAFPARLFISPAAVAYFANLDDDGQAYLNVWVDANRDGDWADAANCPVPPDTQVEAPEHIVIDQQVDVAVLGAGLHTVNVMTGLVPWPAGLAEQPAWLRVTLSDRPSEKLAGKSYGDGRGAPNPYRMGETEDYLLNGPAEDPELELAGQVLPALTVDANGLSAQALEGSWFTQWSWGVTQGVNINSSSSPFQIEFEIIGSFVDTIFDDQAAAGIQVEQNGNKIIYTVDPAQADLSALEEVKILVKAAHTPGLSHQALLDSQAITDLSGIFQATAQARVIVGGEVKATVDATAETGPAAPILAFATPDGPNRQGGVTCRQTIEVVGTAMPGAAVKVMEAGTTLYTTTAGPNGRWSGSINLPTGPHQLYAIQEVNGRPSPPSNIIAILIGLITAQPDPATLLFTDSTGGLWSPLNPEGDDLLVYLENGETYTLSVARCSSDPNTQMIFGGPLIGTVILTDPDGDGVYQGTFTYNAPEKQAGVQSAAALFTLAAAGDQTEFIIEGQLLPVDEHKGVVQDAVTGQPLPGSTVTILSPRDAASGLPTGKQFFDIWPGDLFGQPNPQMTDAGGGFFFPLSPGFYLFDITREGYQPYRRAFNQAETLASNVFKLTPLISASADHIAYIDQDEFSPPLLVVPPGAVVEWVNLDLAGHTVSTAPAQGSLTGLSNGAWESGSLGPGQSYKQRFDTPGTYTYVDQTNPANVAVIVVKENSLYLPVIMK